MNPNNMILELTREEKSKKDSSHRRAEFGQLISAAVVNRNFRNLLLSNPEKALDDGYSNQPFFFTSSEKNQICSIVASSLSEFAAKLIMISKKSVSINLINENALVLLEI